MIDDEMAIAARADTIICVSDAEAEIFRSRTGADVRILRNVANSTELSGGHASRHGFLFVGRLLEHDSPNWHGLQWFVENVWPMVRRSLPSARLSVVGHHNATHAALASKGVDLLGPVDDLTALYDAARVFVAPIQFAAGIPLKVIDAAAAGVPVVGTPLMAEQLLWTSGEQMMTGATAEAFAEATIRLHEQEALWTRIRDNALADVGATFSAEAFAAQLRGILSGDED